MVRGTLRQFRQAAVILPFFAIYLRIATDSRKSAILETSIVSDLSDEIVSLVPSDRVRSRFLSRAEVVVVWLVGHGARAWPFVVFATVLALSWHALRQIRPQEFRLALDGLDQRWLVAAAAITAVNIGAMGLYDVIAFSHTRSRCVRTLALRRRVHLPGATS